MDARQEPLSDNPNWDAAEAITDHEWNELHAQLTHCPKWRTKWIELPKEQTKARIIFNGCHGVESTAQELVADGMDEVAKNDPVDFGFFTGDNLYNKGASHPARDEIFKERFYKSYQSNDRPHLKRVKKLLAMGNHDGNFCKATALVAYLPNAPTVGQAIEKNEVLHTYIPDYIEKDNTLESRSMIDKFKTYQKSTLQKEELGAWNMWWYFYDVIIENINTQFFFINTNSYVLDYEKMKQGECNSNNQAAWLEERYKEGKKAGRNLILICHHTPFTSGKRNYEPDAWHYMSEQQMIAVNNRLGIKPPTKSYNILLYYILKDQGLQFDLIVGAHDHYMAYFNTKKTSYDPEQYPEPRYDPQITVGAGGEKLQKRYFHGMHAYEGAFIKQYGFAVVTIDKDKPKEFGIEFITTDKLKLKFTSLSRFPLFADKTPVYLMELRHRILKRCEEYLDQIASTEPPPDTILATCDLTGFSYIDKSLNFMSKSVNTVTSVSSSMYNYKTIKKQGNETIIVTNIQAYFKQHVLPPLADIKLFLEEQLIELAKNGSKDSTGTFLEFLQNLLSGASWQYFIDAEKSLSIPQPKGTPLLDSAKF